MKRYLLDQVASDLQRKMVFIGGPRQVGKTTAAMSLLPADGSGYLNWDVDEHREQILRGELPATPLVVFDELHKYRLWRNYVKGVYDLRKGSQQFMVTGSARLDYYRYGGDSLQGRYHYFRMHPLSVAELGATPECLDALLKLGGFPEPFFSGTETEARRWSRQYRARLVREDITMLERVDDLGSLELLMMRLPELVGSPLSLNSLREDLQKSHKTISRWVQIFERLYALFRVSPFGTTKLRAVKKEQKHYHFDWSLVPNDAARFENLVASHLLKWVHFQEDAYGRDVELRYFRDVDGREVDFVVTENRRPIWLIECKWGDDSVSPSLRHLYERFPKCVAWQISATGRKNYVTADGIRVAPATTFLASLI